ncbi:Kelch repeat-containing protein, partial [Parabacteroides sp.]
SSSFCTLANSTGFLLGGDTGPEYTDEFWGYITSKKEWVPLRAQPEKLAGQACFSFGFGVWAFGGMDHAEKICDSLYVYSTSDNSWSAVTTDTNRPKGTYRASCCRFGNQVFLIGGGRGNTLLDEVWTYEPITASWSQRAKFPQPQYGSMAIVVNDRIYAGLGIISKAGPSIKYSQQLWSTDESAQAWEEEALFPGDGLLCAVAYEDAIYGVDQEGYIWRYDVTARIWSRKSRLPAANRSVHCMYVLDTYIYIGLGDASKLISYDPTWDN